MPDEAAPADIDGVARMPGAPVLLRELRKCNRRRLLLEPASKFLYSRMIARMVGHPDYGAATLTVEFVVLVCPDSSMTVRVRT